MANLESVLKSRDITLPTKSLFFVCVWSSLSLVQLYDLMDCNPPGSSVQGIPRQEYWSG